MLKKIDFGKNNREIVIPGVRIAEADFPAPFRSGLEYSSPARGTWNIVHTGMLIPEAHEIYVCAAGCIRGVVLTAAEMGASDRFSTVAVRENNLLDGDMEDLVVDGVTDIINKLPARPPAVLVHTSCVHHFTGVDLDMIYSRLRERFPDIDFADCYMNPIMRKSGLTPDQLMRSRLYMLLKRRPADRSAVAIVGSDLPTREDSDLKKLLAGAALKTREITSCKTYEEYQQMAESTVFISNYPDAVPGADMLAERLEAVHFHLPFSFDPDEIDEGLKQLAHILAANCEPVEAADSYYLAELESVVDSIISEGRSACTEAFEETLSLIGDTPIAIDYTYCPRPLSLARMLLDKGFNVSRVYLDSIPARDKPDFDYLQQNYPDLMLRPTVHAAMRFAHAAADCTQNHCSPQMLAIGQKAAYFENTENFVNIVEGGGMNGYEAITGTLGLMRDAFLHKKPVRDLIQIKGLGCEVCIR